MNEQCVMSNKKNILIFLLEIFYFNFKAHKNSFKNQKAKVEFMLNVQKNYEIDKSIIMLHTRRQDSVYKFHNNQ